MIGLQLFALAALVPIWSTCLTLSFELTARPWLHVVSLGVGALGAALIARNVKRGSGASAQLAGALLLVVGLCELVVLLARGVGVATAIGLSAIAVPLGIFAWGLVFATISAAHNAPPSLRSAERRRLPAALAAILLCALFPLGAAEGILHQLEARARRDGALRAAESLAHVARMHDVKTAQALVGRTPLPSGARVLIRLPSGSLVPEDAVAEVTGWPYVERPLDGALRGGAVRVCYPKATLSVPAGLPASLVLLLLAITTALVVSRRLLGDLDALTKMVEQSADASASSDAPMPAVAFAELRRFALAQKRLVERVPRLTVEAYLAVERTEDARRFKSRFLATMSHDLRSPLNSILGFSELLLRGLEGPIQPGQEVVLAAMQASGQSLLRLLNEILDTAKLESGKMEMQRQSSPPTELLSAAVKEARRGRSLHLAERLQLEMQAGLPAVPVDPLRLTQAFTHLLNAALDTEGDDPIVVRASIRDEKTERWLVVDVLYRDEAAVDARAQLFEGFRKVVGRPGLHLALPLARRLIEFHQGTLELHPSSKLPMLHIRCQIPVGPKRVPRPGSPISGGGPAVPKSS